jgi:hypothetical protein
MTTGALFVLSTVMAWGPAPAAPQPIADADTPPPPAPVPPPEARWVRPVSSPADRGNSPTPVPPPVTLVDPQGGSEVRWYGWELLLSDFLSIVAMAKSGTPVGILLGAGGLTLGAPALHLANHNYGTAAASLAVRGGVALLVGLIASDRPPPCQQGDSFCPVTQTGGTLVDAGLAGGLLLGGVVFAIVDDTLLARVTVPRPQAAGLSAFVAPRTGGVSLGLGGNF